MSHAIWHILKHRSNAFAGHGTALFTPPSQSPSRLLSRVMATRSKRSASETGAKHNSDIIKKPRVKASKEEATTNRNQPVAAVSGQLNSVEGYCNALTSILQAHSDPKRKEGSEKYLKHVVKARGLTCPQVCEICCGMFKQHPLDAAMQLPLADKLISSQYMEDKLAAILLLQHVLLPSGQYEWPALLAHMAGWYDSCHVYDWSTSDWLCMRPLHVMVTRCKDEGQREACCKAILRWEQEGGLWRRRSSVVALVKLAKLPDGQVYGGFRADLLAACSRLVRSSERFHQTGTGWVLREVGKGDQAALVAFCRQHRAHFSAEGMRYATEKLPAAARQQLAVLRKEAVGKGSAGSSS